MDEKLQKILARAGLASRRDIEQWIAAGRVQLNGVTAKLGDRAGPDDEIIVDGRKLSSASLTPPASRVLLYYKPEGQVTTHADPECRPTVFQNLPKLKTGRWLSIGRLDLNTSGLLLLTNDGELANRLMHPSSNVEREYAVRILGEIDALILRQLTQGVELDDGPARFERIMDGGGRGANHWYHVVLMEGRNREVRRLWESQGVKVSRLIRVRYGNVVLPRGLRPGKWQEMAEAELSALYASVGLTSTQGAANPAPAPRSKPDSRSRSEAKPKKTAPRGKEKPASRYQALPSARDGIRAKSETPRRSSGKPGGGTKTSGKPRRRS